jgi:hypothetical protein
VVWALGGRLGKFKQEKRRIFPDQWYQSPIGSLESQMSEIFEQRQNVAQRNGELKLMTKTLTTEQLILLIG